MQWSRLEARLEVERRRRRALGLGDIVERFRRLPVLDDRDPDGIIGYDEHGLPVWSSSTRQPSSQCCSTRQAVQSCSIGCSERSASLR